LSVTHCVQVVPADDVQAAAGGAAVSGTRADTESDVTIVASSMAEVRMAKRYTRTVAPGAEHLPAWLDADAQRDLVATCLALGRPGRVLHAGHAQPVSDERADAVPRTSLERAHVSMWDGPTWTIGRRRIASGAGRLAQQIARDAVSTSSVSASSTGIDPAAGGCIKTKMKPGSIARGAPVVSISLGDTARFLFGCAGRSVEVSGSVRRRCIGGVTRGCGVDE
jgi:alkylated DNA repair protein (DNA oxidative demethylase)